VSLKPPSSRDGHCPSGRFFPLALELPRLIFVVAGRSLGPHAGFVMSNIRGQVGMFLNRPIQPGA
jgi:hypothetical protein